MSAMGAPAFLAAEDEAARVLLYEHQIWLCLYQLV